MINALHLLWIIPVSSWLGLFIGALLAAGKEKNNTEG